MSTWFVTIAAPLALFGAGLALTEGTRSETVLPATQIVDAAQITDGTPNCAVKVGQGGMPDAASRSPANGQTASIENADANADSCDNTQSSDQSETAQDAAGQAASAQTPTAFAPALPLAPFIAVPVGTAGLAVVAANDSAG